MRRVMQEVFWVIVILFVVSVQISVITSIPFLARVINVTLLLAMFAVIYNRTLHAYVAAILSGYVLDLYSALPFVFFLVSITMSIMLVDVLRRNVFKGVGFHSTVINVVLGTLFYNIIWLILFYLATYVDYNIFDFFTFTELTKLMFWQIIMHAALTLLLLIVWHFFQSKRLLQPL